ncbi:acriflavin resistance protein [Xanthomonas fragariae]|nr:acriflavin resistance protein [Xanthomonas fragariae]
MHVATWSLRNPIPVVLLSFLLTPAGLYGFKNLSIQALPDLELPTVNVTLLQPGAAPAQLETDVARKVEDSIATVGGLRHLRTTISDGQVQIVAEFRLEKSLSDALIETKDAVDRVRSSLPPELLQPAISAVTENSTPILTYAVTSTTLDETQLSWHVDDGVGEGARRGARAAPGWCAARDPGRGGSGADDRTRRYHRRCFARAATDAAVFLRRTRATKSG